MPSLRRLEGFLREVVGSLEPFLGYVAGDGEGGEDCECTEEEPCWEREEDGVGETCGW